MLVLSRKQDQDIVIGDNIRIKILRIKGNAIRIGIDAPQDVKIVRGELQIEKTACSSPADLVESDSEIEVKLDGANQVSERSNEVPEANVTIVFGNQKPSVSDKIPADPKLDVIPFQKQTRSSSSVRQAVGPHGHSQPTNSSVSFRQALPATLQHNRLKELVKQLTREV